MAVSLATQNVELELSRAMNPPGPVEPSERVELEPGCGSRSGTRKTSLEHGPSYFEYTFG